MNYGAEGTKAQLNSLSSKKKKDKKKAAVFSFKLILTIILFIIAAITFVGVGIVNGIINKAPDIRTIDFSPKNSATTIYDINGNVIETLVTAGSNRKVVEYSDIPTDLIDAFVAIEDSRFWTHNGIDLKGILRAAYSGITSGGLNEGASTITQQLIKNVEFGGGSEANLGDRIERKIQEQYLAIQLEKTTDKTIILQDYLNTINLGNNTLGVEAAAERYFDKHVSELTLSECAVIASITQNPSKYNPITHPEYNVERRATVLEYMEEQGKITPEEKREALADTEDVYLRIAAVNEAKQAKDSVYSYFVDSVIKSVTRDLLDRGYTDSEAYNMLYSSGLNIYTTQDPKIQAIVDEEVNNPANYGSMVYYSFTYSLAVEHKDGTTSYYNEAHVKSFLQNEAANARLIFNSKEEIDSCIADFKKSVVGSNDTIVSEVVYKNLQPQASFVIMDQSTGYIAAISGGRGKKETSLSLNRATSTLRQPGSTFKVLTAFAPALDACGSTLGTVYYDEAYTLGNKNYSNWWSSGYVGYASIRQGITYSMNIVSLKALNETVTPQLGFEYANNFGITSLVESRENADGTVLTDIGSALCLGGLTDGVSNLELTAAYASIANHGVYTEPIFYTKILDSNGKIIVNNEPETHTVLKESTAWLLTNAMQDVVSNLKLFDTGISATSTDCSIKNMSIAGKSGTTTNSNDVWFVGYSPYYTACIWEGYDANYTIEEPANIKGIWHNIMQRVHEGLPDPGFGPQSSGIEQLTICAKCGKRAITNVCSNDPRGDMTYSEYFAKGTAPSEYCTCHKSIDICQASGQAATVYCPISQVESKVYMILPSTVTSDTADTPYALNDTLLYENCPVHDRGQDTVDFSTEASSESSSAADNSESSPAEANTTEASAENSSEAETSSNLNDIFEHMIENE